MKKYILLLIPIFLFMSCDLGKKAAEAKEKVVKLVSSAKEKPTVQAQTKQKTSVSKTAPAKEESVKQEEQESSAEDDGEYSIAYINEFEGECELKRKGEEIGEVLNDIYVPLYEGDVVITEEDARMEVIFDDSTIIKLDSNSRIVVKDLTRKTSEKSTVIELLKGRIYGVVKKLMKEEAFKVKTKMAMAAIKGTEFVVETTSDEGDKVGVYKGQVEVKQFDMSGRELGSVILDKDKETRIVKKLKGPEKPKRLSKNFVKRYKEIEDIREKIKYMRELRRQGKTRKYKLERRLKRIDNVKTLMRRHPKYKKLSPKQQKLMNEIIKREAYYKKQLNDLEKRERRTNRRINKYFQKKKEDMKNKKKDEEDEDEDEEE